MTEQTKRDSPPGPSWRERLGQVLLGEPRDRKQLVHQLREAGQRGLLGPDVLAMIEGALQVSEIRVRDIMVPRVQMVMVELDASLKEILATVIDSGHSRFPVYRETRDHVEGILLAKDILAHLVKGATDPLPVRELMRSAVFIPESKRLNVLLREFRSSRNHVAIVVDEYGALGGLVTIEDVLEQIVGEIDDEHDFGEEETFIKRQGEDGFTVKALLPIEDFDAAFGTHFAHDEFDTVGGLLLKAFEHLPDPGESIVLDGIRFEVLDADGGRIHHVKVDTSERQVPPAEDQT